MQFICVSSKSKSNKELEAFVESPIEEDFHDEAAYGFNQRKLEGKSNNQWKNFVCGPRPTLSRPCVNKECPLQRNDGDTKKCKDKSNHCSLVVLQRYCALPQFQASCCHSCSNYLSK
jgi:hypothetical protein